MYLQLFAQERTEEATPKRREEARNKGQIAKSVELVAASSLLGAYMLLRMMGPTMAGRVLSFARNLWEQGPRQDWSEAGVHLLLINLFLAAAVVVAPVLAATAVAGVVGNLLQVGFLFTLEPLTPSFDRLNPIAGLKRVFSRRALAEMAKSILKIGIIGYVAYSTVSGDLDSFPVLLGLELPQVVTFLTDLVSRLMLRVGLAMLVLALADYFYQRWEYEQSLRMSKQQVKEEFKQQDGNPEIRSKIRQKQRELARGRMMEDVKKADVIVTNPTHYAVALAYKSDSMAAPTVLAKGQGLIALRIRELAQESAIPIVENKPLARELHRVVEVGQAVPGDLYQAVAEVLAFVYQLKQKGY
jgi:flagellar biosynthetic protein FlhB